MSPARSPEQRAPEPSAWRYDDHLPTPIRVNTLQEPLYTLSAARFVWAERLEVEAQKMFARGLVGTGGYSDGLMLSAAARWLREQEGK